MKLILEKEFIDHLTFTPPTTDSEKDIETFLRNDYKGYTLLCNVASADDYTKLCETNPFFELLLDKIVEIKFDIDLKSKIESEAVFNDIPPRTIFLSTITPYNAKKLSRKYGHLIISLFNISESWQFPFKMRKGVSLKVTQSILVSQESRVDSWEKMSIFSHHFKNLIIFDKYLLKHSSPSELSTNIIPLISNLLAKGLNSYDINVTIISEIKTGVKLLNYIDKLKQSFKSNIKFNIIRHSKAIYPRELEGLHARFILTDYIYILSDNSFTFFKRNGAVNAVTNVRGDFAMCRSNKDFFEKDRTDLKLYLSKVKNEPNGDEKYSDMYYPHKTNPLLN